MKMKGYRTLFCLLFFLLALGGKSFSQSSPSTLDVVSWNIEWFGATFNGPADDNLQEHNVKLILRYLNADLYGLCEIVDTMRMRRLIDSLGAANWGYYISPFCSNNSSGTGTSWLNGQKLAFIYRKSIFSNVTTRGLLRTSTGDAYYNWASGRFPYLLNADVTINGVTKNINFIMLHAKSGTTATDYDRRRAGAQELKDTLDAFFPNSINLIIGDFNDALHTTIVPGKGPESSFHPIVADSTGNDYYKSITLPLGVAGQSSMINFPNVIDNHIISNEAVEFYVPGSASIRTDVTSVVGNYLSGNTSDHYPVFSQYNLSGIITALPNVNPTEAGFVVYPNPFRDNFSIIAKKTLHRVQMSMLNSQGQLLGTKYYDIIQSGSTLQPVFAALTKGIYFLQVQTSEFRMVVKLVHL
jgi:hypothetical protein